MTNVLQKWDSKKAFQEKDALVEIMKQNIAIYFFKLCLYQF